MQSLRDYLNELRRSHPDEVVEIEEPVSVEYETTAYWQEYTRRGNPVIIFKKLKGFQMPMTTNIFGTRKRIASMIDATEETFSDTWTNRTQISVDPKTVTTGPVKEVIIRKDADAMKLPIPKYFQEDAGRYITSGIVVANDPDNGVVNLSIARMQLKTKDRFGISLHSKGNLWRYHQKATENGLPYLKVAVVIGCHPILHLAATAKEKDEYKLAGALAGQPVEVVKCETNDIYVPANAEIVLEGKILTHEFEDEGPFSEFTGYVSGRSTRNIFQLDAITQRKDPIYHSVMPARSSEHLLLSGVAYQANFCRQVKASIPEVKAINWPLWGVHFVAIVSVNKKGKEGVQSRAALRLIGEASGYLLKYVIVVDDDIDVFNDQEVLSALATRSQPGDDIQLIQKGDGTLLDPSQSEPGLTSRAVIDATKPLHWKAGEPSLPEAVKLMIRNRFNNQRIPLQE